MPVNVCIPCLGKRQGKVGTGETVDTRSGASELTQGCGVCRCAWFNSLVSGSLLCLFATVRMEIQ